MDFSKLDPAHVPLNTWLRTEKLFTKNVKESTHLLLNGYMGGKLKIPDSIAETFLTCYANDIKNGYFHYICERRTPVFKMLLDMDFIRSQELSDEKIQEYIIEVQYILQKFYQTLLNPNPLLFRCLIFRGGLDC
jgi:5-formaminoimidazole-4-carboxamide-1-beta-D-ribofuranosyl 5'-monophosphate synthetase